jgi:uncharacterized membrane protein
MNIIISIIALILALIIYYSFKSIALAIIILVAGILISLFLKKDKKDDESIALNTVLLARR